MTVDNFMVGTMRTRSHDSYITDSAASATAMACGRKTFNYGVAVSPEYEPMGTIMEAAKAAGKRTGIITTAPIVDATPAAFSCHCQNREFREFMALQQANTSIDILFGGGRKYYTAEALEKARDKGYDIIYNKSQIAGVSIPVLGLFADTRLTYEIDREIDTTEPTLEELVKSGIDLLTRTKSDGFFLLVEQSHIDTSAHEWDAGTLYRSELMLDQTVDYILKYAMSNNDTLVIITADHNTGGMSIGRDGESFFYPGILAEQRKSAAFIACSLEGIDNVDTILAVIRTHTGIDASHEEATAIANQTDLVDKTELVGEVIAKRAYVGWTTDYHTAVDVGVFGYGPGIHHFCGNIDNTEIGLKLAALFDWDLKAIDKELEGIPTRPLY